MDLIELDESTTERILSRSELRQIGYSGKKITRAVRDGTILRVRRDHYLLTAEHGSLISAVRIGGRMTCVTAIAALTPDAFVFDDHHVHVHVERGGSRLRSAGDSSKRWSKKTAKGLRVTWGDLTDVPASRHMVAVIDAVRTMIRCRPEREVIATIDSLLRIGVVNMTQCREIISSLPARYRPILAQLDARAESGTETFMRLILCRIGVDFAVQVKISGVGRVDFVVDGFLIIECDSRQFHEGWVKQRADRRRDLAAAARGFFTLRVLAEDLLHHPEAVEEAVRGLLVARAGRPAR